MKPWDIISNNKRPTDAFIIPLWKDFGPKDFYFACQFDETIDATLVYIVPIEFFMKHKKMLDDSIPIIQHLPTYLEEISEGIYQTQIELKSVENNMLMAGFTYSKDFQFFIDSSWYLKPDPNIPTLFA